MSANNTTATEARVKNGINVRGKAFGFRKWRLWLEEESKDLSVEGYKISYGFTDANNKPRTNLQVASDSVVGDFTNWATGETDFEVLDTKSGQRLADEMGLILDDSNFESAFDDFRRLLKL
jgi:hypothetical protein